MENREKIKLSICRRQKTGFAGTLGMGYLIQSLINSDLFEIDYHEDIFRTAKGERGSTILCNGKRIYLDLWDYAAPTYCEKTFNEGFDLIIKLQDRRLDGYDRENHMDLPDADFKSRYKWLTRKRILVKEEGEMRSYFENIVPWTFFPSKMFFKYIDNEEVLIDDDFGDSNLGFFCGKGWKCRKGIARAIQKRGIEVELNKGRPCTDEEFLKRMKSSKLGVVLGGRSCALTDKKNRREVDYMMMKKPVVMNYRPFYYNELVEGEHYIFIDQRTDIASLGEKYDLGKIAKNGHEWYLNNASPMGAAKVFKKILMDRIF